MPIFVLNAMKLKRGLLTGKLGIVTGGAHGYITEGLKKASSIRFYVEGRQVYMRSSFLIVIPQLGLILLLVKR
jgi:hypothetical protein